MRRWGNQPASEWMDGASSVCPGDHISVSVTNHPLVIVLRRASGAHPRVRLQKETETGCWFLERKVRPPRMGVEGDKLIPSSAPSQRARKLSTLYGGRPRRPAPTVLPVSQALIYDKLHHQWIIVNVQRPGCRGRPATGQPLGTAPLPPRQCGAWRGCDVGRRATRS